MATRNKKAGGKGAVRARRRGKLAPGSSARGLEAAEVAIPIDSEAIAELAALVRSSGGAPIGAYHEQIGRAHV